VSLDVFGWKDRGARKPLLVRTDLPYRVFADMDVEQALQRFEAWLEQVIVFRLGNMTSFLRLLDVSYNKGVERAIEEMAKMDVLASVSPVDPVVSMMTIHAEEPLEDEMGVSPAYVAIAVGALDHARRRSAIQDNFIQSMENVTNDMADDIVSVLREGVVLGLGVEQISKQISKEVGISRTRARTVARTETMRAFNSGLIQQYRKAGVIGVRILAEWLTAGDALVCPICNEFASRDNGYGPGIWKLDDIEGEIPAHPNCRCVAIPVVLPPGEMGLE